MRQLAIIFLTFFCFKQVSAQKYFTLGAEAFFPGIRAELQLNPEHALSISSHLQPSIGLANGRVQWNMNWNTSIDYRYYYNFYKRDNRKYNTHYNSANYFYMGLSNHWTLDKQLSKEQSFSFDPSFRAGWGLKRNIQHSNWYYGLELGITGSPFIKSTHYGIQPELKIIFGYRLLSSKKEVKEIYINDYD